MEKTIIERMCDISETMRNPDAGRRRRIELSDENLKKAGEDIGALRDTLGLNTMQVLIMTAVMENSSRCHIDCDDVADYLGLEYLKFLTYYKDLDDLKSRGYLRMKNDGGIVLPSEVMCAFKENRAIEPEKTTGLDTAALLSRIRRKLGFLGEDLISQREFVESIHSLMQGNPDTSIAKAYRKYCLNICYAERVFFFAVLKRYYSDDDDQVGWFDIGDLFDEEDTDDLRCALNHEVMELQSKGVIEFAGEDGMKTKEFFKIKDNVKDEALADVGGIRKKTVRVSASRKIAAASIRPKELFYNPGVQRQVGQLHELMGEKRFAGIRAALQDKGLRTGFTCLFYGAPGTGKTETVYQIARECGRDLFVVDVAQIKSCWVGESEKNIREVFTRYRASLKGEGVAPILLFNEADAIFGIRKEGAGNAVDKMENSIQNIILQEMEDLDGILIATTNLTTNLDKAFERRFLYKVRFDKPSVEARSRIWSAMIPELSAEEAMSLAADFDFSGGQIENISRKRTVHELIDGVQPTLAQLREYCAEENIGEQAERRRIGFLTA
jgi:hypothetical protein